MIIYPIDWSSVGREIEATDIESTILEILSEIPCNDLSFSGGIDSSLLLYYLLKLGRKVRTFTTANDSEHPDITYSQIVTNYLERRFGVAIDRRMFINTKGEEGDPAVATFYRELSHFTDSIIAGDGLDEFMAGYYIHQESPIESTFYDSLHNLQTAHLIPLNANSGKVKVYLPYIDKRLIFLFNQIPLFEKVDINNRKKIMIKLAQGKLPQEIIERKKYGFCCSSKAMQVT